MSTTAGPDRRPVRIHVARSGNRFMRDISTWIRDAAEATGRSATLVLDELPVPDEAVHLVVAPHELYTLVDASQSALQEAAQCSVPISTEQPGTSWFETTVGLCRPSVMVADISSVGAHALRAEGLPASHLQLGAVEGMDASSSEIARDVDVVFLGGHTEYRARVLATLAPVLSSRRSQIRLFPIDRPVTGNEPGLVFGDDKYRLLARSRVLVNIHRSVATGDDGEYFEWARMVEAMANGCVVLTEPSTGHTPLVAGEHFLEAGAGDLPDALAAVLDDEHRRSEIAAAAHAQVFGPLALSRSVADLLERAEAVVHDGAGRQRVSVRPPAIERRPLMPVYRPYETARRVVYDALLWEIEHRRQIARLRSSIRFGTDDHARVFDSSAWVRRRATGDRADVGVLVTLFDYAHTVEDTLESVVASEAIDVDIVVVDDASRDDGVDIVRRWSDDRPDVSLRLVSVDANSGLPAARNRGLSHLHHELVMVMDADNLVYPTALRRLADALAVAPDAAFAYSTLEVFGDEPGVLSQFGWSPEWLCAAPYIDAQAMLRRSSIIEVGGYRVDPRAYGWEDWDLWLRIASLGKRGVHVPEMLGRYRSHASSMVTITNLAENDLRSSLVDRYPELPWPPSVGREQAGRPADSV
jgi:hypothetical protein